MIPFNKNKSPHKIVCIFESKNKYRHQAIDQIFVTPHSVVYLWSPKITIKILKELGTKYNKD